MNLLDALGSDDPTVRWRALQTLDDQLESGSFKAEEIGPVLDRLVHLLSTESDPRVQEQILYDINKALGRVEVSVALEPLVERMPQLNDKLLTYCLDILGLSQNPVYRPAIEAYLDHANAEVRRAATEALEELEAWEQNS